MDEHNKDVVGARINIDTGKILPALKNVDEGAKQNAASFKALNAELSATEKTMASVARAMDKTVLSAEERRKKIMSESSALVAQRKAQAELLTAKKNMLDTTNQTVEAKLSRQLQIIRNANAREEREAERHKAAMERQKVSLNKSVIGPESSNVESGLMHDVKRAAIHATVFHGIYSGINLVQEAVHTGLVEIESNMAGYIQTNEKYFVSFNEGTHEMVMNTQRLHEETTKFIQTTHDLGSEINEVTESARLWGRMYKDVAVVQEMVRQSTKLSTVDLVDLEDSTKMMESTIAQFGVQIRNVNDAMVQGNRILDSWSKVAHDTMAPARDLGAAVERTGKIADEVGISFDFLNGIVAAGIRNTALSGENIGNMWKTVLGTIRTDKAVKEIENLGVATKEVVDGVEHWRKAEDILLDLSIQVIDKNYDLTKSYQDVARGVFQYAKLAASLNVGDILLGQSASINSTNSTAEYLKVQMDTIERKAKQTKASLLEIFNNAGDDGLRSNIKSALDILDQLLIGITKIPKGVFTATSSIVGLVAAYKLVVQPLMAWRSAEVALSSAIKMHAVAQAAATEEMVIYSAAAANAARMTALATAGITAIVGVISVYLLSLGSAEKKERELNERRERSISILEQQYSQLGRQADFLPKLVHAHNELQKQMDSGSLSVEKQSEVKDQLEKVSRALKQTIGEEGLAQLEAAGYTDEATQIIIESLNARKKAVKESILDQLNTEGQDIESKIKEQQERIKKLQAGEFAKSPFTAGPILDFMYEKGLMPGGGLAGDLQNAKDELEELQAKANEVEDKKIQVEQTLLQITMSGEEGKEVQVQQEYEERKQAFLDRMSDFQHLVNTQAEGYKTASEQLVKLKEIRQEFSDLNKRDLYGIDEDIFKTSRGKQVAFSLPLKDIDSQRIQAEQMVSDIQNLIDMFAAQEFSFDQSKMDEKLNLYERHQNKLHSANNLLKDAVEALNQKQRVLNELLEEGRITTDEYNKSTEDVQNRIKNVTGEINRNSIAWWNDAKAMKEAKEEQLQDTFAFSEKWIAHQKSVGQLTAQQEYEAWLRVQARYKEGTELRMRADEQVFAAKQALLQDEERSLDDLVSREKQRLDEAKQQELESIQDRRDKYVEAQDEKIRAIERLMQAEQQANDDDDYEDRLNERKARAKLLESAVGPEGKKERKEVLKEIADMEEERRRELRKRDLETLKQTLEEQKQEKEKEFEAERLRVEQHYDDLLTPLDQFKNDVEGRAEAIKQIQILKENEKNAEILAALDQFIIDYQSRMSRISNPAQSQKEIDLQEYNRNKDLYEEAKKSGDSAEMARLNSRNNVLRSKYGITQDTGKLQHFDEGGVVQGVRGMPVHVLAHAGEMYLNPAQQGNLFKLLDFVVPKLNFSMPSFAMASGSNQTVIHKHYYNVSTGDVNLHDDADIRTFWGERDNVVRRFQARSGVKEK